MTARPDKQKAQLLARTLALRSARKFLADVLRDLQDVERGSQSAIDIDSYVKSYRHLINQIDEALK